MEPGWHEGREQHRERPQSVTKRVALGKPDVVHQRDIGFREKEDIESRYNRRNRCSENDKTHNRDEEVNVA